VINVFEAVDVIALIKGGVYEDLDLTVGEALLKRSDVSSTMFIAPPSISAYPKFAIGFRWNLHLLDLGSLRYNLRHNP
jgi:hypothetical protein